MERDRRIGKLGKVTLAGALVFGGGAAVLKETEGADAGTVKTISCTTTDHWYGQAEGVNQGDRLLIKASGVVIPGDVSVDGIQQYDNNPDTATLVGLKSRNNSDISWRVDVDYPSAILVLPCKTGSNHFYTAVGREGSRLDARLGANDAEESVDYNFIKK